MSSGRNGMRAAADGKIVVPVTGSGAIPVTPGVKGDEFVAPGLELNFPNAIMRQADLFDRTSELELICETVGSPARRIAVIMGERRTGKTSLLKIVQMWASQKPGLAVVSVPPVSPLHELITETLDGMAAEADTSLHELGYRDTEGAFTRPTVTGFVAIARELSDLAGRSFLVCIDELDSLLANCPNDQSRTEILDFITHVSNTSLPIRFVFTLSRATHQIVGADATPFITTARIVDLGPWAAPETREFVEWLLSPVLAVDASAHELLYAEGGGHPYLTKAILQGIVNAPGKGVPGGTLSADQVRAGVAAALANPEVQFTLRNIVTAHFSADDLLVLRRLAPASAPLTAAELAPARETLDELLWRHYVRASGDGYVLAFGLLGRWLLGRTPPNDDRTADRAQENGPGIAKLVLDSRQRRAFLGGHEIQLSGRPGRSSTGWFWPLRYGPVSPASRAAETADCLSSYTVCARNLATTAEPPSTSRPAVVSVFRPCLRTCSTSGRARDDDDAKSALFSGSGTGPRQPLRPSRHAERGAGVAAVPDHGRPGRTPDGEDLSAERPGPGSGGAGRIRHDQARAGRLAGRVHGGDPRWHPALGGRAPHRIAYADAGATSQQHYAVLPADRHARPESAGCGVRVVPG
jgi:hypothetical protein